MSPWSDIRRLFLFTDIWSQLFSTGVPRQPKISKLLLLLTEELQPMGSRTASESLELHHRTQGEQREKLQWGHWVSTGEVWACARTQSPTRKSFPLSLQLEDNERRKARQGRKFLFRSLQKASQVNRGLDERQKPMKI